MATSAFMPVDAFIDARTVKKFTSRYPGQSFKVERIDNIKHIMALASSNEVLPLEFVFPEGSSQCAIASRHVSTWP